MKTIIKSWGVAAIVAVMFTTITCYKAAAQSTSGTQSTAPEIPGMVWIPAGTFTMGEPARSGSTPDETPHQVTLTQGFYMGKYLVTQTQYEAVTGKNPSYFHGGDGRKPYAGETQENRPVEQVSWYEALMFCNKLSIKEGLIPVYRINKNTDPAAWGDVPKNWSKEWDAAEMVEEANGYRLPTEAQWEYACRAGTTTAYNTGDTFNNNTGWYDRNSGNMTREVGLKPPNDWGLYDMHGNVREWCWDWYGKYASEPQTDPTGAASGHTRVARGGAYNYIQSQYLRSAYRGSIDSYAGAREISIGFRLIRP